MKARMNVYFEPEILRKVDELAARRNLSKSLIIEAAVSSFLSPDAEDRREAAFSRRLDRLIRQNEQLERHLAIYSEAVALYVRFWLDGNPTHARKRPGSYKGHRRRTVSSLCRGAQPADRQRSHALSRGDRRFRTLQELAY